MNDDENKRIMAQNIKMYMEKKGVSNQQLCDDLGFKYTTFRDWIKGVTYPRIGKVEAMAQYFGCEKSDLIEQKWSPSFMAQKIAAAYDQATAKEKNIVEMILSAYLPAEEDRKAPVRFAAYSKDGTPVDFTGADPNAPIPHPFVKGDDIP